MPGVTCSNCGQPLPDDDGSEPREPCPRCGSTARTFERELHGTITATGSVSASVERAVNAARVTALLFIVSCALAVGVTVGFETCAVWGVVSGVGAGVVSAALLAAVYRVPRVRQAVMTAMHKLTGE